MNDDPSPASSGKKTRGYRGKDLWFDKVKLRVTPEDFEQPETSDSELGSDEEEEAFGLDEEPEIQGARRSKRASRRS